MTTETTETADLEPPSQKLRVAVLLEDLRPPAWIARVIRDLQSCPEATLVALGQTGASAPAHSEPVAARALRKLYELADARAFPLASDPFERVEISGPSVPSSPSVPSAPSRSPVPSVSSGPSGPPGPSSDLDVFSLHPRASHDGSALELDDADLARLARHRLDVILSFLPRPLGGGVLSRARYGVWTYHFGEEQPAHDGPDGFWEVVDQAPVTRSALRARSGAHHARLLYESWSATDPISVRRSRASCYWKSSAFVLRALRELHDLGPAALERKPLIPLSPPRAPAASGRQMAVSLARFGGAIVRREAQRRTIRDQWTLAYRLDPGHRGSVPVCAPAGATRLSPPLDRFWA